MKYVRDFINQDDITKDFIDSDKTVFEGIKRLTQYDVGALAVVKNNKVVGVFSERDYTRKVELFGRSAKKVKVSDVMTPDPICVTMDMSLERCVSVMQRHKIRHLPVVDREMNYLGCMCLVDLLGVVLDSEKQETRSLKDYVAGAWPF